MTAAPRESADKSPADLLLDLGNTRIKWARCSDGRIGAMSAEAHDGDGKRLEDAALWTGERPRALLCASVAGTQLQQALASAARSRWGLAPEFAAAASTHGRLRNSYMEPSKMGVDRWLALVGAAGQCTGPFAVIDAGTAVTVDVVDNSGAHLGGWIFPGSRLMVQSLRLGTARVRPSALDSPQRWGQDTAGCVAAGIAAAVGGAVKTLETLLEESNIAGPLFLTGGDAVSLAPLLSGDCRIQPDLVLRGLRDVNAQT